jgi:branched-chain amino acid transport system permease protein
MLLQAIISGLISGSNYALIALGLVIIFKASEVANFGHGELFMLGAYGGLLFYAYYGMPYYLVYLLAIAGLFIIGVIFQKFTLAPIVKAKAPAVSLVITTLGLSFLLKGMIRLFKASETFRSFPPIFGTKPIILFDIVLTPQGLVILITSVIIMGVFFVFFRFTKMGKAMQAVSMNPKAASLIGINVQRMFMLVWGIAAALAAAAGIMVAPIILIHPDMGSIAIKAFAAGIIGGFTSLPGAVVGGILIGIVENLVGVYISTNMIVVTPFLLIMITLVVRPGGLFTTVSQKKV